MRLRCAAAVAFVLLGAAVASAQDATVLGRDDVEFAQALVENDYADLAGRLLHLVEADGNVAASAVFRKTRLDIEQIDASKIDDPILRRYALVAVLYGKERFIDDFRDTPEAVEVGDALPEVCGDIAETIAAAIRQTQDTFVVDALRTEGDSVLERAEERMLWRIEALKALNPTPESDDYARWRAARYNQPHLRYFHALLYAPGSDKRKELCEKAATQFEEFDLDFGTQDDAPMIVYYAYVDEGLCLRELGKTKEAVESFDKVIALRGSYGDADATTGVYPIPAEARDMVELVGYAVLQKVLVLRDANKLDDAVAAGKDYLATMPRPFDSRESMLLANALGDVQLAKGDAGGAAETARRMIREDPDGVGGRWGSELLERGAK